MARATAKHITPTPAVDPVVELSRQLLILWDADCPSSDDMRLIRHFEKGGSAHQGLEFKRPAVDAASDGLRWWQA